MVARSRQASTAASTVMKMASRYWVGTNNNTVRSVRIGGIDEACKGNEMFVHIFDKADKPLYQNKVTISSTQHTISFPAPYLVTDDIEVLKLWIEGLNGK